MIHGKSCRQVVTHNPALILEEQFSITWPQNSTFNMEYVPKSRERSTPMCTKANAGHPTR